MSEPYPHPIDPAEIIGPLTAQRDAILAAAAAEDDTAAKARANAKAAAERVLAEGEQTAQHHERAAAHKRSLAERWGSVIAREQAQARGVFDPTATAQDTAVAS
jgi:hypothetical protein